jgi:hypothetical protein
VGGAAGGWFIPFANLVIPYQVMRVLWSSFGDERSLPEQWWAAWIGFLMLRFVGYVVAVVNQPFGDVLGTLGEAIGIVAGFLLITMIRRITRRGRDRQAEIRGYSSPKAPWIWLGGDRRRPLPTRRRRAPSPAGRRGTRKNRSPTSAQLRRPSRAVRPARPSRCLGGPHAPGGGQPGGA